MVLAPGEARDFPVDPDVYKVRVRWTNADLFAYGEKVADGALVQIQAVN